MFMESFSYNISEIDIKTWQDPYVQLGKFPFIKVVLLIVILACLALAIALSLGMISYEYYGGNPNQRTLLNQLVTNSQLVVTFGHLVMIPFHLWRIIVGPVTAPIPVIAFLFFRQFIGIMLILYMCEYATILYCFIVVWKRIPSILDDFWSSMLRGQNMGIAFMIVMVNVHQQATFVNEARFLGIPADMVAIKSQLSFRMYRKLMAVSFALLTYVSLHITWVKWRMNKIQPQVVDIPMMELNPNHDHADVEEHQTEDIITAKIILFIFVTGVVLGSVATLRFNSDDPALYLAWSYVLQDLTPYFTCGVLLPSIAYLSNPSLRSYVYNLLTRPY